MVVLQSRSKFVLAGCGLLMVWGVNRALAASNVLKTIVIDLTNEGSSSDDEEL